MDTMHIDQVHFIGVGGVGMSGIARVAFDQGMRVSGTDLKESRYTKQLREAGIEVHIGHDPANIPEGNPVIVVSTAILDNNPELAAAKARGLTIWHRAQMLAYLGRALQTLAVAGTHGKTTTSSMLASVLDGMGEDPTFLIGGIVRAYGTNAHSGTGAHYVVEADESDKSFMHLSPRAVLVTNIEADHLDHYRDLDEIYEKFASFIGSVPDDGGVVVACGEDEALVRVACASGKRLFTYGFSDACDVRIASYEPNGVGSDFTLELPDGSVVSAHVKQNPGRHNVLNGFAHVHVLFQPHRYSRAPLFTEVLKDDFGRAFDAADAVTFMDVYPAGEAPVPGVSGKTFLNVVLDHAGHPEAAYVPRRIEVVPYLAGKLGEGDLLITMGAGDVTAIGPQLVDALSQADGAAARRQA